MESEGLKGRIRKLEKAVGRGKMVTLIFTCDATPDAPPDVSFMGHGTLQEKEAIKGRILAEWKAERAGRNPEVDLNVLEARLKELEERTSNRKTLGDFTSRGHHG